ncbi:hypothetical protein E2R68_06785 [Psychromonas sp. RZ22]|nr:hypothetical protein E2R68_06785 [Psychromonas sp. RZ22]
MNCWLFYCLYFTREAGHCYESLCM